MIIFNREDKKRTTVSIVFAKDSLRVVRIATQTYVRIQILIFRQNICQMAKRWQLAVEMVGVMRCHV